jgi:hypothetical protein
VSRTPAASRDPGSASPDRVPPIAGPTSSCKAENAPEANDTPHTAAASTPPGRPANADALVNNAKDTKASSRNPARAIATATGKWSRSVARLAMPCMASTVGTVAAAHVTTVA